WLGINNLNRLVATRRNLKVRCLVGFTSACINQEAYRLRPDLERPLVGRAVLGIGTIQRVEQICLGRARQGDAPLVSGWINLVANLEIGSPPNRRTGVVLAGLIFSQEVERAFSGREAIEIVHRFPGNQFLWPGCINDHWAFACVPRGETQDGLAGVGMATDHGDVDSGLVFGERSLFDIPILTQSPATLLQCLRLEGVHTAATGHPGPNGIALGTADDVLPRGAPVVLT